MPTALVVLVAWCVLSVVCAGVHYRWVRYELADTPPMDTLQVLPAYEPVRPGDEISTPA